MAEGFAKRLWENYVKTWRTKETPEEIAERERRRKLTEAADAAVRRDAEEKAAKEAAGINPDPLAGIKNTPEEQAQIDAQNQALRERIAEEEATKAAKEKQEKDLTDIQDGNSTYGVQHPDNAPEPEKTPAAKERDKLIKNIEQEERKKKKK